MAAMSRGNESKGGRAAKAATTVVKPRRKPKQTPSSRRHYYESFALRIAKLKIDPLRRTRRAVGAEGSHELERDSSYFRVGLEEWKDINLSENFTAFAKDVYPITDSLAMVIHYEDRIMDSLMTYIAKGDGLSLEPLLALLSHFAHDLDVRFEKHFQRAVATVVQVAASQDDAGVVEWTFSCLAWLFKYLSRLLVPDLRPLYDLMAPYLGKKKQKPYVIRFAAEAMSFLVRKAGSQYNRNKEPLETIVEHMINDYASSEDTPNHLYAQGLMTLFTESIKGVQGTLHSGGNAVLHCLTSYCFDARHSEVLQTRSLRVMKGSLISVLHHTNPETFHPIQEAIFESTNMDAADTALENIDAANTLLFTVASVRKGSRISDWSTFVQRVTGLIKKIDRTSDHVNPNSMTAVLNTLAVILNYAPFDTLLPELTILDTISRGKWSTHFLHFCNLFAGMNEERFQSFVLASFQKFIVNNWKENEVALCALLPSLSRQGKFAKSPLQCPLAWQKVMLQRLKKAQSSGKTSQDGDETLYLCNGQLAILRVSQGDAETRKSIGAHLLELLKSAAKSDSPELDQWDLFALGQGFQYISDEYGESLQEKNLAEVLCSASQRCKKLVPYWTALNTVLQKSDEGMDFRGDQMESLVSDLIDCLRTPSHDLRLIALQILKTIYEQRKQEVPELLTYALSIEDTPPSVQTVRFISAQIRRLALGYSDVLSDPYLAKAIPTYCFGLLHIQLSQAWDDAIQALKDMSQHEQAETVITDIISTWLQGQTESNELSGPPEKVNPTGIAHVSSDFECSNLLLIELACDNSSSLFEDPREQMRRQFERDHAKMTASPLSERSQALRALNSMPQLAEKRSRLLVPVLLEWSGDEIDAEEQEDKDDPRWGRKDQKALLGVFAQFQNPRVLYRTAEVYQALLNLLTNGDTEIQKSALKAVLAWKTPSVNKYQDHLLNFLDDARFREEVSVFLRLEEEGDAIRSDDCEDLMPVLLRILYGKAVTRAGSASGKRGQHTRRKAIFVALARFPAEIVGQFLEISLGSLAKLEPVQNGSLNKEAVDNFNFPPRKQVGLLNMLDDMVETLGNRMDQFASKIADAVLLCLLKVSKSPSTSSNTDEESPFEEEAQTSLDRSIRQAGFHCLVQLFSSCTDVSWHDHAKVIMEELIGPRLEKLPVETAQSVSGIMRLFSTWCNNLATSHFLTDFYPETLTAIAGCLTVPSARNEVKLFVVQNIIGKLLDLVQPHASKHTEMKVDLTEAQEKARIAILEPHASLFVVRLGAILRQNPPKEILDASVLCVSRLAPLVSGVSNIRDVIDVSTFLLSQPPKNVHHTTKRDLLQTLYHLTPAADLNKDQAQFDKVYSTLCPLFAFFKDRESRELLSAVVKQLGKEKEELAYVASLCEDLNSFSASRLDEPDFERRAQAFSTINEERYATFSAAQWQPLVYSMLYYIKDNEELAIRTSASFSLRRFVEAASVDGDFRDDTFKDLLINGLFSGLQTGMREPSELVRNEYLQVLAHLIKNFHSWTAVNDMTCLLVDGDDEASFFTNILHIQQHRRLRALRRLADDAHSGVIASANVSQFFIPLLEHFIFDPVDDDSAHNLSAETILAVGALAGCLDWPLYRATLRRFVGYVQSKQDLQKVVLRLVSRVIDALDRAAEVVRNKSSAMEVDGETDPAVADGLAATGKLAATLPSPTRLSGEVNKAFLPPLTDFLHLKDESTVSIRVPVAVAVVKLIRVLPVEEHAIKLPSVLMDVCHILRSKATEARDMTRKTLSEITGILGPSYFGFVVKELRSALQRGYQLHVMSFTVHSILVDNIDSLHAGDLDHCLNDIIAVVMDDIFGVAGQEKDAEEYISKMKEVKSSKSYDSAELVAKITSTPHLGDLIRPIQSLLKEKLDLKTVKKIDELLRRIGLGTTQNGSVKDRDILVFCYEIIQKAYAAAAESKTRPAMEDYKIRKYLIQMQSANKSGKKGATSSYTFKLMRFALDLVRSVLQKHDDLKTPANLTGFLPILGDSLIGGQEEVQMAAVRLLTSIIKVPAPQIVSNGPVYASEAVKILRAAPSTTTELAQAALKLVSAILRERPDIKIKENDMAYVLKRVRPDLEEPDRQGVIFNFLKAVMTRKIVITEVYEVLDTVAAIMVTNQTRTARDLARGVYFQFMMDYPQASNRLTKQIGFLVQNLDYKYLEGRQSVLELLHLLLSKTNGDLVQELSSMLFVPLVMMMVNDDSPDCREMAGTLISKILERADEERIKNFVDLMRTWLEQDEQVLLRRIALQCWTLYIGHGKASAKETSFLFKQVSKLLNPDDTASDDWELLYYALQAFAKLSETSPATALASGSKQSWTNIFRCLNFPHTWVKLSAARLVGLLFANVASASSKTDQGLAAKTLYSSGGLQLTEDEMLQVCRSSLRNLRFENVTEQLVGQTVRNLIFLGRCYGVNNALWKDGASATPAVDGDEEEVDDEEEAASEAEEDETTDGPATALSYLFARLSSIVRRDVGALTTSTMAAKTGCLQATAALCNTLPSEILIPHLETILQPLYLLTDATIAAPRAPTEALSTAYKNLESLAQETSSMLQKKLGTADYIIAMRKVQEKVRSKREDRRRKRRIEAVSAPEKAAADKRRKHDTKKIKRKEKSSEARGRRRGW